MPKPDPAFLPDDDPSLDDPSIIERGEWVKVWAQVKLTPRDVGVHPEDFLVEVFSHNEQYDCHVRADRVEKVTSVPDFVETCTALRQTPSITPPTYQRCARHHGHGKAHRTEWGNKFSDNEVVGYFEDA